MKRKQPIKALVFDAYGTLFDVHSVIALCDEIFPGQGAQLSQTWRAKQLEYTWLKSLIGRYQDFGKVTEAALKFSCKALKLDCPPQLRYRLMQAYLHLEPYPEVKEALASLSHCKIAILSNGSPRMLKALVKNNGLGKAFDAVISVDEVKISSRIRRTSKACWVFYGPPLVRFTSLAIKPPLITQPFIPASHLSIG